MTSSALQNMAPNTQRSLILTLAFVSAAIVIYMFCIQPAQLTIERGKRNLEEVQTRYEIASRDIRGHEGVKERLDKVRTERKRYIDALLTPLLESYAMRAKSILDPVAAQSGVAVQEYLERPRRLLPLNKPQAPQLYARQPIRLSCRGSYQSLVSFVMRVEKLFPLVSLQSFVMRSGNGNDVQSAEIIFEWPVEGVNTKASKGAGK